MKKLVTIFSLLAVVAASLQIGAVYSARIRANKGTLSNAAAMEFAQLPLDEKRTVRFEGSQDPLSRLDTLERQEQLRDWLLYTLVSAAGLSADAFSQSLYDLPVTREGYMRAVGNFQHGNARWATIRDGQVVALLLEGTEPGERSDDLVRIADEYRKNTDEIPAVLHVFEYQLNMDELSASLVRRSPLQGSDLFKANYGYYEAQVDDLSSLENFMQRVDDITYATVNANSLTLGGRKLKGHAYRNIRVEDVAAIWQATQQLTPSERLGFSLDFDYDREGLAKFLAAIEPHLRVEAMRTEPAVSLADIDSAKAGLAKQHVGPVLSLIKKLQNNLGQAEYIDLILSDPGDSLQYFTEFFTGIEPTLHEEATDITPLISLKEIEDAKAGLTKQDAAPFITLLKKLKENWPVDTHRQALIKAIVEELGSVDCPNAVTYLLELRVRCKYGFLKARYNDDLLPGTEVGMVLFYTDLMMKLWAFDYENSAPSEQVPGVSVSLFL